MLASPHDLAYISNNSVNKKMTYCYVTEVLRQLMTLNIKFNHQKIFQKNSQYTVW